MSSLLRTTTDNDGGGGNDNDDDDVDDLFTSLGGTLMKELLADLTMEDDYYDGGTGGSGGSTNNHWLNLEQLEMELRQYERSSSGTTSVFDTSTNNNSTVAGWLVNQPSAVFNPFPTYGGGGGTIGGLEPLSATGVVPSTATGSGTTSSSSGLDAWSLSFQKFTASSLEEDFLLADSQRKQQQQPTPPLPPPGLLLSPPTYQQPSPATGGGAAGVVVPPPGLGTMGGGVVVPTTEKEQQESLLLGLLRTAEDYDTTEQPRLPPPPPGLGGGVAVSSSANRAAIPVSTTGTLPGPSYPIIEEDEDDGEDYIVSSDVVLEEVKEKLQEEVVGVGVEEADDDDNEPIASTTKKIPKPLPPTPHNSIAITSKAGAAAIAAAVAAEPKTTKVSKATVPKVTTEAVAPKVTKILSRPQDMEPLPQVVPPPKSQQPPPPALAAPVVVSTPPVPTTPSRQLEPTAILQRPTAPLQPQPTGPGVVVPVVAVPIVAPQAPHHQQPPPPGVMIPPPNAWQTPMVPPGVPLPLPPPPGAHFGGPHPGPPPGPPPKVLFCNPHYNAPPIPATIIRSRFMKPRDITYVVHGILKSIIFSEQGQNPADRYDIQYYQRHIVPLTGGPPPPVPSTPAGTAASGGLARPSLAEKLVQRKKQRDGTTSEESKTNETTSEMEARRLKGKEWSQSHAVLGQTMKTDVTRPRALIAVTPASLNADNNTKEESAGEQQRQRAALWKARIYIDQGYQAYRALTEIWRNWSTSNINSVNGTGVPPAKLVQPHLVKLFKCFGISGTTITPPVAATTTTTTASDPDAFITEEQEAEEAARAVAAIPQVKYSIDPTILQLVCKLPKGKILVSRVLEQGLLPPPVVHVLLPAVLGVLVQQIYPLRNIAPSGTSSSTTTVVQQREQAESDDRIFRILTRILQSITELQPVTIVTCCTTIQDHAQTALSSTTRMQCTHALLHRGSLLASSSINTNEAKEQEEESLSFQQQWTTIEQSFLQILSGM